MAGIFSDESVGDQTVIRNVPVCASGYNLKDVLDVINSIQFESEDDIFTITRFYEDLLIQMGNENRIAGEFHTPRPVIRFMVDVIDPQIGETVYDPAGGSCGFPAQAYLHMEPKHARWKTTNFCSKRRFMPRKRRGFLSCWGR
ncbi:MAG: N-6 DNA methylase [Chloroflexi bacterium]|nr:N-6 DNA methylase [Chloroflexota bacterium]